jgi:hypothetical protein
MLRVIHLFHTRFSLLIESAKPKVPSMEKPNSQLWPAHWPKLGGRLNELLQLSSPSPLVSALRLRLSEWARSGFVNAKRYGLKFAFLCLPALVSIGIVSAQAGANLGRGVRESSGAALPGVTVNTLNTHNNVAQVATTGSDRDDRGVNLQPATHGMIGTADGVGTMKQEVPLLLGTDQTVKFAPSASSVARTVTMAGAALNPIVIQQNKQTEFFFEGYNIFNLTRESEGVSSQVTTDALIRITALDLRILQWGARCRF